MFRMSKGGSQLNVMGIDNKLAHRQKIHKEILYKQEGVFGKKWSKKYFVLYEGKTLAIYESARSLDVITTIDLQYMIGINESNVKPTGKSSYKHAFEIKMHDRVYVLAAPDVKAMNKWIEYLKSSVFGRTIHKGWLTKQGEKVKSWKKRYFVLTDTKLLRYFEDEECQLFKGVINVQHIKKIEEADAIEPNYHFIITIEIAERVYLLNCYSENERQEWLSMLDEGQKTVNFDKDAAIFVGVKQQWNFNQTVESLPNQRLRYIIRIYEKWCVANKRFRTPTVSQTPQGVAGIPSIKTKMKRSPSTGFSVRDVDGNSRPKGVYEILNSDLKDYTTIQFLNDFEWMYSHFGLNREGFLEFFKFVLGQKTEGPEVPAPESLALIRNWRDRMFYSKYSPQRKLLFNGSNDAKEITAQIALDRLHSFVMYSYDTVRLHPTEWSRIKDYDETDKHCTANKMLKEKKQWMKRVARKYRINDRAMKFMFNVIPQCSITGAHVNALNGTDGDELLANGMPAVNPGMLSQPTEEVLGNIYEEVGYADIVDMDGGPEDSKEVEEDTFVDIPDDFNRIPVRYEVEKGKNEKSASTEESGYFEFGHGELLYWEECKEEDLYIPSTFASLKEEITQNKYCTLSMQQWDTLYQSACEYGETSKAMQFSSYEGISMDDQDTVDHSALVEKYGIFEYTPIKINHIAAILLYCNYYQLQQMLMSTYAPREKESVEDWKGRHGQFAHWARHLVECCHIFGKVMTKKDVFYHSINSDILHFGQTPNVSYEVPTAMTRTLFVAQSYFEYDPVHRGMLLSVAQCPEVKCFYMDCAWCSDFPQENEVLVFAPGPHDHAMVQFMVHARMEDNELIFQNYQFYMSAIADLDKMIAGKGSSELIGRHTKQALDEMITYRMNNNNAPNLNGSRLGSVFGSETDDEKEVEDSYTATMTMTSITTMTPRATPRGTTPRMSAYTGAGTPGTGALTVSTPLSNTVSTMGPLVPKISIGTPTVVTVPTPQSGAAATNHENNKNNADMANLNISAVDSPHSIPMSETAVTPGPESDHTPEPLNPAAPNGSDMKTIALSPGAPNKVVPPSVSVASPNNVLPSPSQTPRGQTPRRQRGPRPLPFYIRRMFDDYCVSVKRVYLDFSKMVSVKHGYRAWKKVFMNGTPDGSWIRIGILVQLFPNLERVEINYVPQAFSKHAVKALIRFLKKDFMTGRDVDVIIYRRDLPDNSMFEDKKRKSKKDKEFTLLSAMEKYLLKHSKVGNDWKWFCRYNADDVIPFIQIIRPHKCTPEERKVSVHLNQHQMQTVMDFLHSELAKNPAVSNSWFLQPIYCGSRNGFLSETFHEKCDGKAHTVVIVKTVHNGCLFGGYTSRAWDRTGKFHHDDYAFLFSIQGLDPNVAPRVINIKKGHEPYGHMSLRHGGPGLGQGDVKLFTQAHLSSKNTCSSNSFEFTTKPVNELTGGKGSYFKVADYEVFQVVFF